MRVLIPGVDGYLGWSLAQHLASRGHEVAGIDNYMRRDWVAEVGSQSATPFAHDRTPRSIQGELWPESPFLQR